MHLLYSLDLSLAIGGFLVPVPSHINKLFPKLDHEPQVRRNAKVHADLQYP